MEGISPETHYSPENPVQIRFEDELARFGYKSHWKPGVPTPKNPELDPEKFSNPDDHTRASAAEHVKNKAEFEEKINQIALEILSVDDLELRRFFSQNYATYFQKLSPEVLVKCFELFHAGDFGEKNINSILNDGFNTFLRGANDEIDKKLYIAQILIDNLRIDKLYDIKNWFTQKGEYDVSVLSYAIKTIKDRYGDEIPVNIKGQFELLEEELNKGIASSNALDIYDLRNKLPLK